jgi:hypothetical protein
MFPRIACYQPGELLFCDTTTKTSRHCSSRYCHCSPPLSGRTGHTASRRLLSCQRCGCREREIESREKDSRLPPIIIIMEGTLHESSSNARKRPREAETEQQRIKREKAAERQRKKRERDRKAAGTGSLNTADENQHIHLHAAEMQAQQQAAAAAAQQHIQQQQQAAQQGLQLQQQQQQQPEYVGQQDLTPAEITRRDKVRAAARERQRKHRLMVKQRRMRELGLDMGNEIIPGMEEVHYRATPDGQYHQVLPPELQQQLVPPHAPLPHEPPFPQGAPLGGQTFASTLLLSFSCAPLLKQHLLRTLGMSNEELASLEPIIAEAWDRWDHQVCSMSFSFLGWP